MTERHLNFEKNFLAEEDDKSRKIDEIYSDIITVQDSFSKISPKSEIFETKLRKSRNSFCLKFENCFLPLVRLIFTSKQAPFNLPHFVNIALHPRWMFRCGFDFAEFPSSRAINWHLSKDDWFILTKKQI